MEDVPIGTSALPNYFWTYVLHLCTAEKEKLNYNNKGLTKHGWSNVYRNFKEQTGWSYSAKQMQNKFTTFKRNFIAWRDLQKQSGFDRDKTTGDVTADDGWWDNDRAPTTSAAKSRGKPPAFEEELTILFGSHGHDRGTLVCGGGVGKSTQSGGSKDTPARMSEDPIGWSSVGLSCKRPSTDVVVDGPPKKKSSSSIEEYIARISETLLAKSSREGSMCREHDEIMEVLDMLKQDGVDEGTELHFIATELFRNPFRRNVYKNMKSAENRRAWLEWTWKNTKK